MAKQQVIDAVEARLAARWSECPVIGVNLQGEPPPDGSTFMQVQYPYNTNEQIVLGRTFREGGGIRFIIKLEQGVGVDVGTAMAGRLADLFRNKKFGGVQTFSPSSPVIDDRNDTGGFYDLSFAVPYEFIFTDAGSFYD